MSYIVTYLCHQSIMNFVCMCNQCTIFYALNLMCPVLFIAALHEQNNVADYYKGECFISRSMLEAWGIEVLIMKQCKNY